jgi:hypothetical protein
MRLLVPLLAVCALAVSACGNDARPPGPAAAAPKGGATSDERIIREWSADLRRGDVAAASARFALPATVANGTPPVTVRTRELLHAFHETLPCGGVPVAAEAHHGLTIARFRLTDRPGGDCGTGVGGYAAAAFEIKDGLIVRWLRVDDPGPSEPPGPVV